MRALILEDDLELGMFYTACLETLDYDCTLVGSCDEALTLVLDQHFDLYLLDLFIGPKNSRDIARVIRLRDPYAQVFVITGSDVDRKHFDADHFQADHFLKNPVDPHDIGVMAAHVAQQHAEVRKAGLL